MRVERGVAFDGEIYYDYYLTNDTIRREWESGTIYYLRKFSEYSYMFHNLSGPARIYSDGEKSYYIDDEELTEEEFYIRKRKLIIDKL